MPPDWNSQMPPPQGFPAQQQTKKPRRKWSRKKKVIVALIMTPVVLVGGLLGTIILWHNWSRITGKYSITNEAASLSYSVPFDGWVNESGLVLPIGGGQWGGIVEYGMRECTYNGRAGVSSATIASSPYPMGVSSTPETAVNVYTDMLPWMVGKLISVERGKVQQVTVDGVRGARLDVLMRGWLPECGPYDPNVKPDIFTIMAFPAKDLNGKPIMAMIYLTYSTTRLNPGDPPPVSQETQTQIINSIHLSNH
jgi:hypothetical protein